MARRGHTWTPSDIPFLDYRRFWTFLIGLDALPGDSSAPCTRHKLCLAPPSSRDYWVWRTPSSRDYWATGGWRCAITVGSGGAWDPLCTIGGGVGRSADPPQAPLFSIIRGLGDSGAPWTPSVRSSAILGVPDRRRSLFFDHWGFWVIMIVADRFFSIIGDSGRFCPIPDDSGVVWTHLDTFRYPFFSIFGDSGRFWSFFIGPDTLLRDHRGDWATTGRVGPGPLFTRLLRGRSEGWRGPPSARSALGERHSRQAESSLGLSG